MYEAEELIEELLKKHLENVSVNHWINAIDEYKIPILAKDILNLFREPIFQKELIYGMDHTTPIGYSYKKTIPYTMNLEKLLTPTEKIRAPKLLKLKDFPVKELTWDQLSFIAPMLIETEYGTGEIKGDVILASEAIKILTNRAILLDKSIF